MMSALRLQGSFYVSDVPEWYLEQVNKHSDIPVKVGWPLCTCTLHVLGLAAGKQEAWSFAILGEGQYDGPHPKAS